MIKVIGPGSYTFKDEPLSQLVKMSSGGLRGNDLASFIKRAGHQFVDSLRHVDRKPGEELIHLLALGSTEYFGPNRNGDGFKEAICRKYHPAFVKHARLYRNHLNKDKAKSYGVVKLSAYNEAMKRIELLVAVNGTKEAADRNGGLVGDQEMQKLAKDDNNWGVSMATRVSHDICSGCGNKARTRDEYCTEDTCKYGGLKHNITKVAADGHVLHADNPDPIFFDISTVYRPADRIAYVLGPMQKAASFLTGIDLAEAWKIKTPYDVLADGLPQSVASQVKLAHQMAEIEERLENNLANLCGDINRSFFPTPGDMPERPSLKTAQARWQYLTALTERQIALPVEEFLLTFGNEKTSQYSDKVRSRLPGVYGRLVEREDLVPLLEVNPYRLGGVYPSVSDRHLAVKLAEHYSLAERYVRGRVSRSALSQASPPRSRFIKAAAVQAPIVEALVEHYALYKLAMCHYWKDADKQLLTAPSLLEMVVRQNYV